jgi:twitching motility protein PilT
MSYHVNELLINAYTNKASDLHITAHSPPIYRVNGQLVTFKKELLTSSDTKQMAKSLMTEEDWDVFLKQGEIDFSYRINDGARFRLNVYMQREQISFVARIIPTEIPTIEQLNMPDVLRELAEKSQGLVLVTGPTGSGKSTTLAAMIDYINEHEAKHIITLEDPIEYLHSHRKSIVHQREVGLDTKKFSNGLRAALRQDPDVILVGEMRDLETISTAITAAETGHLVLATLHTNGASQTIHRIIDVFPPHQQSQVRIQLATVLEGIISQRLLPNIDGTGRLAATEILMNQPAIANLIRNEKVDQITNILQTSRSQGMHTLEMSVKDLLNKNAITLEAAQPFLQSVGEY